MQLAYRKFGEGQPLLILHGLFGQSDNWNTLAKRFAEQGFEVYAIELQTYARQCIITSLMDMGLVLLGWDESEEYPCFSVHYLSLTLNDSVKCSRRLTQFISTIMDSAQQNQGARFFAIKRGKEIIINNVHGQVLGISCRILSDPLLRDDDDDL